jgi:opacity protein-like surface antigen
VRTQLLLVALLVAPSVFAQPFQLGGSIGYGLYRNGTIFGPGSTATAGIHNRFAAGAVFSDDLYEYISGEFRYIYQDGHPFLSSGGVKTDIQGQSHALTYDLLFHFEPSERRLRFFVAAGAGAKGYIIAGPVPSPQPLANLASLTTHDEWNFVVDLGGGVKYRLASNVILRLDFRDYLTAFPKLQIVPATNNTARGIFQQFTPMFGVSYVFGRGE